MFSIIDMFKVGVGPSSSHTVGPMVAAQAFAASLDRNGLLERVARVRTTLYGSATAPTGPPSPGWRAICRPRWTPII